MGCDETYSTNGPECPYCGHNHGDTEPVFYDDGITEMACDKCQRLFQVSVCITASWTCEQIAEPSP